MSNDPLPTIHGYQLVRPLGKGSYGSVWEARGHGGFRAALKFISLAHAGSLAEPELKALEESKELNHPHLVQTREVFIDDEWVIIVMEYAAGSLRERFQHCRQNGMPGVPVDELLHYTRQAADALDYLHSLNKLHRDIKPDNLLITSTDSPHVKVGDCGLLRDRDRMTTMAVQGSPPYIAPEAWVRQTTPASDQFSLAATYVEMRMGRLPFEGSNAAELSMNIQFLEPSLEGLDAAEQEVLKVALAKTPEGRFLTCRDFVNALESSLAVSATTYRARAKIGLHKKAVTLAPPRVAGASLKPASQPVIDLQETPPQRPGPPVTLPPPDTRQESNLPPTFPPAAVSATAKGAADGTMKTDRPPQPTAAPPPPRTATPHPPTYGAGTLMPGARERERPSELAPLPEELSAPKEWKEEEPPPAAKPQQQGGRRPPPPGLGFGAILAAVLVVAVLGGVGFYVVAFLLNPAPNGHASNGKEKEKDPKKDDGKPKDQDKKDQDKKDQDKKDQDKKDQDKKDLSTKEKDGKPKDGTPIIPKKVVLVPAGFEKAADSREMEVGGKTYAARVVKKKGTMVVPFRLMAPEGKPPFYVMEEKLSNGLYRAFEEQEPDKAGGTWRAGGLAGSSDRGSDESRLPALRMTRSQAAACATWLGGRLPRAAELDYAAGLTKQEGRDGPAKEERNVAVGRRDQGPQSLDEKTSDISPLEVRDLSGNGWEWTADELMAGGRTMAVLRGQRYTAPAPLTYAMLTEWQKLNAAPTQYPDVASPYTGFRVVVDIK